MTNDASYPSSVEAREALATVSRMQSAGRRLAAPSRWFGAGVAILIAGLFGLYALDDPYPYVVLPICGLGVLAVAARARNGAALYDLPAIKASLPVFGLAMAALVLAFLGTVFARRAFDLAWLPIVVGLALGLVVVLLNEDARRKSCARPDDRPAK